MKLALVVVAAGIVGAAGADSYCVYVRPKTQDVAYEAEMGKGNGTRAKPYYAVQLALEDVAKNRGDRMAEVVLLPGEYRVEATWELMSFGEKGGVLRGEAGGKTVLTDAQVLGGARFKPVFEADIRARLPPGAVDRIRVADLTDAKMTMPSVNRKGEFSAPLPLPDVVVDGQRCYPAKWPNDGWAKIVRYVDKGSKYQKGKAVRPGPTFEYSGDAPRRWQSAPYVWLQGYWAYDWNERVIPVEAINPEARQIQLASPHEFGVPNASANATPRRWRALHLLEELDAPGEFFLDVANRKLYVFPPDGWKDEKSEVRLSAEWRSLIFAKNTPNIALRNLVFKGCYGIMANFKGCRGVSIQNCTFTGGRDCALVLTECPDARVSECSFHDLGAGALRASAGNRRTLTSGGIVIENNRIWDCGQLAQNSLVTDLNGVGLVFRHNLVENVPHIAMRLGGNDNVIEYNIFRNCCRETDDASVIYKGRDPSCTGNVIRWNYFDEAHSIHSSSLGTCAVYFDDGDCGDLVYGCVFRKCGPSFVNRNGKRESMGCVFSHWGFEARVDNCLFIDCGAAVASAPCNDAHWKKTIDSMKDKLRKRVDVEGEVYTAHYPWIKGLTTPKPGMRRDNYATRCAVVNGELPPRGAWKTNETYVTFTGDPGFVDAAGGNYRLRTDSEVYRKIPEFDAIPFEQMGPLSERPVPRPAPAEMTPRDGIGNVMEKIRAGKEITVAYFGGSITEMDGWRRLSLEWLRTRYPSVKFREVNAAIGGTGSPLGVFRYAHDVLSQKPDLVFVEFATNDLRLRPETIARNFDGFLRQTWRQDPLIDVVFAYTVTVASLSDYLEGRRPPSAEAMENVAAHYGIPSVDFGWHVTDEVRAKRLVMSRGEVATAVPENAPDADEKIAAELKQRGQVLFARDGVHPTLSGHRLYMDSLTRLWMVLETIAAVSHAGRLSRPYRSAAYESARMVPIKREMLQGEGWKSLSADDPDQKAFGARAGQLWCCARPGGRMSFSFKGTVCKIYDLVGPDGGQVNITVDGIRRPTAVPRFDSYCTYRRLAEFVVFDGADGIHSVEIEVAAEQPSRQPLKDRHPEVDVTSPKYKGTVFIPGQVMLVGELVGRP